MDALKELFTTVLLPDRKLRCAAALPQPLQPLALPAAVRAWCVPQRHSRRPRLATARPPAHPLVRLLLAGSLSSSRWPRWRRGGTGSGACCTGWWRTE